MEIEEYEKKIVDTENDIIAIKLIIKHLKEEANENKLPGKINQVIMSYGKKDWDNNCWYYYEKDFSIYKRGNLLSVKVRSKEVFRGFLEQNGVGEIEVYISGLLWEKRIEALIELIPLRELRFKLNGLISEKIKLKEKWEVK